MPRKPIPVVLVAGFLGSGKTTLLNHLLTSASGVRIGVLVNDFGSINIDAMAVAGQVDSTVSLANGCLCCAVDARGLDAMLATLADADLDVIVIEASGLAEPRGLIRMLLASENPALEYGGLLEVVDAAEFDATRQRHPELAEHLKFADLVVLNKTDRIGGPRRAELAATVGELAGGVPVLPVEHGRVDPALLFDIPAGRRDDEARQLSFQDLLAEEDDHAGHAHAAYDTVEFTTGVPLHPRRFQRFLADRPAGLYRVKGFVHFGQPGGGLRYTLHTVGSFLRLDRGAGLPGTQLVLIGTGIDTAGLLARLRACEEADPAAVDEQAMLGILRFLPENLSESD
ncbi:CobW family GTP-binding protein [Amycolatopsis suaedae]|nr:GTP-binding protein [Amycolatopsis suaedae]